MLRRPLLLAAASLLLCTAPAQAMHISEGILPANWAGLWLLVAFPFLAVGLRTIKARSLADPRYKLRVALLGAGVFVVSCMPIPVPFVGTCSHPCGVGLAAILLGLGPTVALAAIALTLQALFLAHGGLSTLGANIVSMGLAGGLAAIVAFRLLRKLGAPAVVSAGIAAVLSDWATYATTSIQLALGLHGAESAGKVFAAIAVAFLPTQVPLGLLEGVIIAGAYKLIVTREAELASPAAEAIGRNA